MEMGSFIKLHRQKKEMTQGELAKGIVSLSYLSKIENKKTDASPEIMQMLCTRLGVQMNNELDADVQEKCKSWYGMLFAVNDKEEIVSLYNELQAVMDRSLSGGLVMFEIHKIRYYLLLGELQKALNVINELNEMAPSFNHVEQFYWYKFRGNYYSLKEAEFNESMKMYKLAEERLNQIELDEKEAADLQYTIAVTHSKLRNTLDVIDYASKAMEVFQKEYNFIRCAQCHILLGISYRRIKMYDKAIKNHNLARHLGELNKNKNVIQLTNQNLGHLYSTIGKTEEAIKYFVEVEEDEKLDLTSRLTATTSLIKEYYNIHEIEKSEQMIDRGLKLLDAAKEHVHYELYYYIIHTYLYAINEEHQKFKSLVTEEFLPYLKDHKDYGNLVVYANMLGSHFEKAGKYKESVKYFKLANLTYEELINL